jgi:hypothetical protein
MFHVPDAAAGPAVPPRVAELVEESCKNFEKHLREELGMFAGAMNVAKWVNNYRAEVTRLALAIWSMNAGITD